MNIRIQNVVTITGSVLIISSKKEDESQDDFLEETIDDLTKNMIILDPGHLLLLTDIYLSNMHIVFNERKLTSVCF